MAKGAFVVTVTEQRRNPGTQRHVTVTAPLRGVATSAAAVVEDVDTVAEVALEATTDGKVTATGTVAARWRGECRRCLEVVEGDLRVQVQEVFEREPAEDAESYRLDGDLLDLEPMVRDAVLLALPLAPLCDTACAGPDPAAFPVLVEGEGTGAGEPPIDPRWAKLSELRFD